MALEGEAGEKRARIFLGVLSSPALAKGSLRKPPSGLPWAQDWSVLRGTKWLLCGLAGRTWAVSRGGDCSHLMWCQALVREQGLLHALLSAAVSRKPPSERGKPRGRL